MNAYPCVLFSARLRLSLISAFLVLLLLAFIPRHARAAGSKPDEGSLDGISNLDISRTIGCVIQPDGLIACSGLDSTFISNIPVGYFSQVTVGDEFACALNLQGEPVCWGFSFAGNTDPPPGKFVHLSAGMLHTCAVRVDGRMVCWGDNTFGESDPPPDRFTQVTSGSYHSCGLRQNGSLACWGRNEYNQASPPAGTFIAIGGSANTTCAIHVDGSLACWGDNTYGQSDPPDGSFIQVDTNDRFSCGLHPDHSVTCWGFNDSQPAGSAIVNGGYFRQIASGASAACALTFSGELSCWGTGLVSYRLPHDIHNLVGARSVDAGDNTTCALNPDGTLTCLGAAELAIQAPPAEAYQQVTSGVQHACALRLDGTLQCWGINVGYPDITPTWQSIPPPGEFTQVSAGGWHNCALRLDGYLFCWGLDGDGQSSPPSGTFIQVDGGWFNTCGIRTSGSVACWGLNNDGQSNPPAGLFAQISTGGFHVCGVHLDGTLECWGYDSDGQASPPAGTFQSVSAGSFHTCGVRTNGDIACWGDNSFGQSTPPAGTFTQIASGESYSCARDVLDAVTCWGYTTPASEFTHPQGTYALIFDGAYVMCGIKSSGGLGCWGEEIASENLMGHPVGDFSLVGLGQDHGCALRYGGLAVCWGDDSFGQSSPPTSTLRTLSVGGNHTCAITEDGLPACWGDDSFGQSSPPTSTLRTLSAGGNHNCAISTAGLVTCWGDNSFGQSSPPTSTLQTVSAGTNHSCGITLAGTLACWGEDAFGQSSPPPGEFRQVSAGERHSCGLRADHTLACWGDDTQGQSTPPPGRFLSVAVGQNHSCAIAFGGGLLCWGDDAGDKAPRLQINPHVLPYGEVDQAYTQTLTASGGTPTYTFSLVDGALPSGFSLQPAGLLHGTPVVSGTFTFTVQAADQGITQSIGMTVPLAGTQAYTLWIFDAPTALDDTFTSPEDSSLIVPPPGVLANDYHPQNDFPTALLITSTSQGELSFSPDGSFSYTPTLDYHGVLTFTYQFSDGLQLSNPATVSITVASVNDPPLAGSDAFTTTEDAPLQVPSPGVLTNDSDVDGDPLLASLVQPPPSGDLLLFQDGGLVFTPTINFNGVLTFTYQVSDGLALSGVTSVTLTVTPVNDPPLAEADAYITLEDTSLVLTPPGVLTNDSDVDGDPLLASLVKPPPSGDLLLSPDGGLVFTPTLNFNGVLTFTYQVSDGLALSDPTTVTLTVSPVDDPPSASLAGPHTADEGQAAAFTALLSDPDDLLVDLQFEWDFGDGQSLSGTVAASPLSITHTYLDQGIYTLTLTLHDPLGASAQESLPIAVANLPPVLQPLPDLSLSLGQPALVAIRFDDPGVLDAHQVHIDWGDGLSQTLSLPPDVTALDLAHLYLSPGDYPVAVSVADEAAQDARTFSVQVLPLPPPKPALFIPLLKR